MDNRIHLEAADPIYVVKLTKAELQEIVEAMRLDLNARGGDDGLFHALSYALLNPTSLTLNPM